MYLHPMSRNHFSFSHQLKPQRRLVGIWWLSCAGRRYFSGRTSSLLWTSHLTRASIFFLSQVKEAMQRIHDRGNIGKLILDVEKTPTPLVSQKQGDPLSSTQEGLRRCRHREGRGKYRQLRGWWRRRAVKSRLRKSGVSYKLRKMLRKEGKCFSENISTAT